MLARTRTAPPIYLKYTPGGKDEFIRDVNAYQAACLIYKTLDGVADELPVPDSPAPEYNPNDPNAARNSVDEANVFRTRFLEVLVKLKDFMANQKRRLPDSLRFLLYVIALFALAAGGVIWLVFIKSTMVIAFVIILWLIIFIHFMFTVWKFYYRRRLIRAIDMALDKVERFERLDDKVVADIKRGVYHVVPKTYWPLNPRLKTNRPPRYDDIVRQDANSTAVPTECRE
ncbi:hypothetical protein ABW19_dt0207230 [Dactylella cylindrospora]|nr:hypothetical protein ABW19_dt0207230 [Dactylella cylindrospora]